MKDIKKTARALSLIDERFIDEAAETRPHERKKRSRVPLYVLAGAACAAAVCLAFVKAAPKRSVSLLPAQGDETSADVTSVIGAAETLKSDFAMPDVIDLPEMTRKQAQGVTFCSGPSVVWADGERAAFADILWEKQISPENGSGGDGTAYTDVGCGIYVYDFGSGEVVLCADVKQALDGVIETLGSAAPDDRPFGIAFGRLEDGSLGVSFVCADKSAANNDESGTYISWFLSEYVYALDIDGRCLRRIDGAQLAALSEDEAGAAALAGQGLSGNCVKMGDGYVAAFIDDAGGCGLESVTLRRFTVKDGAAEFTDSRQPCGESFFEGLSAGEAEIAAPLDVMPEGVEISAVLPEDGYSGVYRLAAEYGSAVYAVMDGTVELAEFSGMWGKLIRIAHTDGTYSFYAHLALEDDGMLVAAGDTVKKGQRIGSVGTTGYIAASGLEYGRSSVPYAELDRSVKVKYAYCDDGLFHVESSGVDGIISVPSTQIVPAAQNGIDVTLRAPLREGGRIETFIPAAEGSPVYAVEDGTVKYNIETSIGGCICLQLDDGSYAYYGSLAPYGKEINRTFDFPKAGARVSAGQLIGFADKCGSENSIADRGSGVLYICTNAEPPLELYVPDDGGECSMVSREFLQSLVERGWDLERFYSTMESAAERYYAQNPDLSKAAVYRYEDWLCGLREEIYKLYLADELEMTIGEKQALLESLTADKAELEALSESDDVSVELERQLAELEQDIATEREYVESLREQLGAMGVKCPVE